PLKLASRGLIPWRLLAYMLDASPEVEPIRRLVGKRLMESGHMVGAQKQLHEMLMTLWAAGYVKLEPEPPPKTDEGESGGAGEREKPEPAKKLLLDVTVRKPDAPPRPVAPSPPPVPSYQPKFAHPTPDLPKLLKLRGINPLYGIYLVN